MKLEDIRFFTPEENKPVKKKEETAQQATGYISATGKVIIPQKSADEVGLNPEGKAFRIGVPENKRKLKSLYVLPTSTDEEGAFEMKESGRNYFIPLGVILENSGVDFQNNKYTFDVNSFQFDNDVTGYELKLNAPTPKTKRAGRKPKSEA
jgi:hypothetical protein